MVLIYRQALDKFICGAIQFIHSEQVQEEYVCD